MGIDGLRHVGLKQFLHERTRFPRTRPQQPRVLAVGEPLHGDETFPRVRNELFRQLIDDEGSRCVTLESDCLAGRAVDDYVCSGEGQLDRVMVEGFSHEFGASPANRALVDWLGRYNSARSSADQVRFAGFDAPIEFSGAQSPRAALRLLHNFLATTATTVPHSWSRIEDLLGDDEQWTNPAAAMDPARSIGDSVEVRDLRAITDDLERLLRTQAPQFAVDDSAEALRDAELAARTAAGLLAYHKAWAVTDSESRLTRSLGIRDSMMASNLRALAAHEREHDHGPVLVFAHNNHLRRDVACWQLADMELRWSPAGSHLARTDGPDYVVIATAFGSAPHLGIGDPPPDTVEGVLAATTSQPVLVSASNLTELVGRAGDELNIRTTGHPGYFPLDPETLGGFDAVLFLPHLDSPGSTAESTHL